MRILVACEESQAVCIAFRERGHEAYSCDVINCSGGHPEWHVRDDARWLIGPGREAFETMDGEHHSVGRWDLLIAHPPCTFLTNASAIRMKVNGGSKDAHGNYRRMQGRKERDPKNRSKTFEGISDAMSDQWG